MLRRLFNVLVQIFASQLVSLASANDVGKFFFITFFFYIYFISFPYISGYNVSDVNLYFSLSQLVFTWFPQQVSLMLERLAAPSYGLFPAELKCSGFNQSSPWKIVQHQHRKNKFKIPKACPEIHRLEIQINTYTWIIS